MKGRRKKENKKGPISKAEETKGRQQLKVTMIKKGLQENEVRSNTYTIHAASVSGQFGCNAIQLTEEWIEFERDES